MSYNNWKKDLRDVKYPLLPIDHLNWPDFREPSKDRDSIRIAFRQLMKELHDADPDQYRSIPIKTLLDGLGKTCTKLKAEFPKKIIRIALSDFYQMAGIRVISSGEIQMNHY